MGEKNDRKKWSKRKLISISGVTVFILFYIGVILWHTYKPLPEGLAYEGEIHWTDDVELFTDLTYANKNAEEEFVHELTIFDEIYDMIDRAEEFIVLDFFLFDHYSDESIDFPEIVQTMTAKLVEKKESYPEMRIVFITDPLNSGYGSYENEWFEKMKNVGIEVVYTELDPLRDSTPIYSGLYRTIFSWMDIEKKGWIENAMASEAPKMTLASYMTLLNVKANHRKTMVTEQEAIITSGNPHNASGFHGNVALKVKGSVLNDILEAEEAVVKYTNGDELPRIADSQSIGGEYAVQYLTEKKILDAMLADIARAEQGDTILVGMFYIAKQDLVDALIEAANRGVKVKMILDPNENSFGNKKTGLPNRPVVHKMIEASSEKIEARWYNTVVGQYHTKLVVVQTAEETYISNGSANLTERTLDNYNLEANLRVIATNDSRLTKDIEAYFERIWTNKDGEYTLDVEEYQDHITFFQRGIILLQKLFKLTTY